MSTMSAKTSLNVAPVDAELKRLTRRALNHLERQWPRSKPVSGRFLLRGLVAACEAHRQALHHIFFSTRTDGGEEGRLFPSATPVARSMLEILMLAHFVLDDLGPRVEAYLKAGWGEQALLHAKFKQRFGTKPRWQDWLSRHATVLREQEALVSLSPAERADPQKVPYWPNPGKFIKKIRNRDRMKACLDLEAWYYGELSAGAHAAYSGLAATFSLVVYRRRYRWSSTEGGTTPRS